MMTLDAFKEMQNNFFSQSNFGPKLPKPLEIPNLDATNSGSAGIASSEMNSGAKPMDCTFSPKSGNGSETKIFSDETSSFSMTDNFNITAQLSLYPEKYHKMILETVQVFSTIMKPLNNQVCFDCKSFTGCRNNCVHVSYQLDTELHRSQTLDEMEVNLNTVPTGFGGMQIQYNDRGDFGICALNKVHLQRCFSLNNENQNKNMPVLTGKFVGYHEVIDHLRKLPRRENGTTQGYMFYIGYSGFRHIANFFVDNEKNGNVVYFLDAQTFGSSDTISLMPDFRYAKFAYASTLRLELSISRLKEDNKGNRDYVAPIEEPAPMDVSPVYDVPSFSNVSSLNFEWSAVPMALEAGRGLGTGTDTVTPCFLTQFEIQKQKNARGSASNVSANSSLKSPLSPPL